MADTVSAPQEPVLGLNRAGAFLFPAREVPEERHASVAAAIPYAGGSGVQHVC